MACPLPLNLVCDAVGSASSSVAGSVLSAIAGWVIEGATWLLDELGKVIASSTSVDVRASWFLTHYKLMLAISAVVAVPMLMLTALQAVFHQNATVLLRAAFIHLPLAALLTGAVVQLVQLALEATDALCTTVSTGTGGVLDTTFHSIGAALSQEPLPLPTFVLTVGALLIVAGAFVLWLELLVRSAAIYAAVLFLPLALASLVWPAVSHWCRRLTETLAALVLSKFVVVAVLSLAVGAVSSGDGFSTILAGGALLLLAAFTPFTLLRLIPLVEVGAAMQLEGARQRVRAAAGRAPDSAVGFALRQARELGAHRETMASPGTPGPPGTGTTVDPGAPGPSGDAGQSGPFGQLGPSGPSGEGGDGGPGGAGEAGDHGGLGGPGEVLGDVPGGEAVATGAALATGDPGLAAGSGLAGGAGGFTAGEWGPTRLGDGVDGEDRESGGSGGLAHRPIPREWLPGASTPPPGTIPVWPGSPESVAAALAATRRPHRVEPDGYGGGLIPGVASPLFGGTEPMSRFEPGPKDDWGAWDLDEAAASHDPHPAANLDARGAPPIVGASRLDAWSGSGPGSDGSPDMRDLDAGTDYPTERAWEPGGDRDGE